MNKIKIIKGKTTTGIFIKEIYFNGEKIGGVQKITMGSKLNNNKVSVILELFADIEFVSKK